MLHRENRVRVALLDERNDIPAEKGSRLITDEDPGLRIAEDTRRDLELKVESPPEKAAARTLNGPKLDGLRRGDGTVGEGGRDLRLENSDDGNPGLAVTQENASGVVPDPSEARRDGLSARDSEVIPSRAIIELARELPRRRALPAVEH